MAFIRLIYKVIKFSLYFKIIYTLINSMVAEEGFEPPTSRI